MRFFKTCILIAFIFLFAAGYCQEVTVTAKLDTNAMLIGDHVGLTLKYTGPSKSQVLWPFLPDTILGSITVIGRGKIDTTFSSDKKSVIYTQALNITCYDSGFYTVPSIPFKYRLMPDTSGIVAQTSMMLLAVHTVKVDTTQAIKPIIGPLKVPITFREMLPWILAALAAILVIIGGIWYFNKRRKNQPVFTLKPKVVLPPHERALREIEQLRVKKLWQAGRVKEYHSELTEILRRYIEDRFRVPALEQTSAEITQSLRDISGCPHAALDKLGTILILADMVKFAKVQPLANENEKSLNDGIEFVHETTNAS
ncbi:MAG: BatA domain-containing protein [Bacteroidetes bacterium]|nr:BatA domain-containing protein [Bacteroidota bacterium]